MKKYISLLLVLGVVLGVGATPLYAQKAPAKAAETAGVDDATKLRVVELGDTILKRMAAVLGQQAIIGTQLESRVARLEGKGANVTTAIARVKDVHTAWDKARINFEELPEVFNEALSTVSPEEGLVMIRSAITSVRDEIRSVNRKFGDVITLVAKLDAEVASAAASAQ